LLIHSSGSQKPLQGGVRPPKLQLLQLSEKLTATSVLFRAGKEAEVVEGEEVAIAGQYGSAL
jgi:hypothetical protein